MGVNRVIVESVFAARDKLSKTIEKMTRKSDKFGGTTEAAFKKASKSASKFGNITKGILAANVIGKGFALLNRGVSSAVDGFITYDDAIVSASAKFKGLNLTTEAGLATMERLKKTARDVGATTKFSATEAAEGLDFLALAGFSAEQAMAALPDVTALATVGQIDLGRAVDIASDSLGAFGLMTKDSAQLQKNLARVNDNLALTMASTNTNIEDMFEAIKKGAPDFTAAGQSIETFTALLGVLANSGKKGSEAGIALKTMMLRLTKSSPKVQAKIKELNITVKDNNGNFRDAIDILEDVEKATKNMGTATRAQALNIIFGDRAVGALNILLKDGTKSLREFRQAQIDSAGAARKMADVIEKSLGNRLKSLQSAALEFAFNFLEAFKKDGVDGVESLISAIRKFDPSGMIDGIKTVASVIGDMFTLVKSLLIITSPLTAAWAAYNIVIGLASIKTIALGVGTSVLTAAQWLLNIAMTANPIGLIVAGVVGLIALVVLLVTKWDVVKTAIVDGAMAIFNIFSKIFKLASNLGGAALEFIFGSSEEKEVKGTATTKGDNAESPIIFRPPNENEQAAQKVSFEALLSFENAPAGLTGQSRTRGAPAIPLAGLGTQ